MRTHDFSDDSSTDPYEHLYDDEPIRRHRPGRDEAQPERRGRLTQEARERLAAMREDDVADDLPPDADRWSTWDDGERGPLPHPDWVVTELAAVDRELGVLKTGKEADVHLLERALPGSDLACLLAAKRYRDNDHRMFHRDAGYLEGRRMRRSREMRAIQTRTTFGRNLIAEQWAIAEFTALGRLWSVGAPVPYPVQRNGTELLLEFLGDPSGTAAPRLAQLRPCRDELDELWHQLVDALMLFASQGLTHGDLSAYNLLVDDGRLVVIDLPQVVDIVANPAGEEYLARDVRNVAAWFHARGLSETVTDGLIGELMTAAGR